MTFENVCHGCLSVDRKLSPVDRHAKLYHLLLLKKCKDKTKMILLCWECHKNLKNVYTFRMKITQAQKLLNDKIPKAHKPLSNLTYMKNIYDYHAVVYEEEKINTLDFNIEVKEEKQEYESPHNSDHDTDLKIPEISDHDTNLKIPEISDHDADLQIPEIKEECKEEDDIVDDCFGDREELLYELDADAPVTEVKVEPGAEKRRVKKKKYKIIIMADIKDKRSFYDVEKIDQSTAQKWMEKKKKRTINKKFQCSLCFCSFSKQEFYERHLARRHDKNNKYECDLCGVRLALHSQLRNHVAGHYVQFLCKLCGQAFPTRDMLYIHLAHGPHTRQMECRLCPARFDCNKARQFFQHYRSLHGSKICDYCGLHSTTKRRLAHHIKSRHTPILCKICGVEFKYLYSLKTHNDRKHTIDTSERNYCVECDVQFANSLLYREHVSRSSKHRVKPRIPCPECDKTYSKRCYMMNHYNMEHLKNSKHICNICGKRFLTGHRLRCHQKFTHEKIPKPKNNICNYCGRGFNTKRILENHVRTHTGERPFACEHCSAAFTQTAALKSHMRSAHK